MRTVRPFVVLLAIAVFAVACSSNPSPGAGSQPAGGNEPSVPAGQSQAAAASQPAGSGGVGDAPALADGPWTGGQGQTTVSGAVTHTTDAPLTTGTSSTEEAKTLLAYNTDDAFVTIMINFTGVPFHADVTTNDWSALSDDCQVTYARADDTGIEATFSCVVGEFHYFGAGDDPTGEIKIEGSFTATR
jgi:hypothetical protein